jgi:hypothetical protein
MDRVPAFCQFLAQLRADYAAATVRGINRDADIHCCQWSVVTSPLSVVHS